MVETAVIVRVETPNGRVGHGASPGLVRRLGARRPRDDDLGERGDDHGAERPRQQHADAEQRRVVHGEKAHTAAYRVGR